MAQVVTIKLLNSSLQVSWNSFLILRVKLNIGWLTKHSRMASRKYMLTNWDTIKFKVVFSYSLIII